MLAWIEIRIVHWVFFYLPRMVVGLWALSSIATYAQGPRATYETWKTLTRDGASALEAYAANLNGLQKADCLIRIDDQLDTSGKDAMAGKYEESRIYHRIRFDKTKNCFAYFATGRKQVFKYEEGELRDDVARDVEYAFVFQDGKCKIRNSGAFESPSKEVSLDRLCNRFQVPALHAVGFHAFGFPAEQSMLENFLLLMPSVARIAQERSTPTVIMAATELDPKFVNVSRYKFDMVRMVPESWVLDSLVNVEGRDGIAPGFTEKYDWLEKNNVYVPVQVSRKKSEGASIDGSRFCYRFVDARIHWLNVNEPMSEKQFSEDSLQSSAKIQAATDPKVLKIEAFE